MSPDVPLGLVDWRLPVSAAEAVAVAANLGVNHLQVDLGGPGRAPPLAPRLPRLLDACRDHGVGIDAVACNHLNDLGLHDHHHTERVRQTLAQAVEAAHALQAPMILVPGFRQSCVRSVEHLRDTGRQLAWACDLAQARGLEVAYEGDLGAAPSLALMSQVGRRNFKLLLDPDNLMRAGHALAPLLKTLTGRWCGQIHIKGAMPSPACLKQWLESVDRRPADCVFFLENDYRQGLDGLAAELRQLGALLNHLSWRPRC